MISIIGAVGASIILVAYLLELFEHVSSENKLFLIANIIGSVALVYYAWLLESSIFMIINVVWALGSLYELVKKL